MVSKTAWYVHGELTRLKTDVAALHGARAESAAALAPAEAVAAIAAAPLVHSLPHEEYDIPVAGDLAEGSDADSLEHKENSPPGKFMHSHAFLALHDSAWVCMLMCFCMGLHVSAASHVSLSSYASSYASSSTAWSSDPGKPAAASAAAASVPHIKHYSSLDAAREALKLNVTSTNNLNTVVDRIMGIGIRFNLSERAQSEIIAAMQEFFPGLPSFYMLQRVAAERTSVSYEEFPICRNQCSTCPIPYGRLTAQDKSTISCPVCKLNYIQTHEKLHYSAKSNKTTCQVHALSCICMLSHAGACIAWSDLSLFCVSVACCVAQ